MTALMTAETSLDLAKPVLVNKDSLPVSCPQKGTPAWDMHPRVYIDLSDKKGADCPYCGAHFELVLE